MSGKSIDAHLTRMAATESSRDISLGRRPPWPGSPISSRWTATYSIPGSDTRLEGGLILHHVERHLVLLDREGIVVDVRQADPAISIEAGTSIDFPFYHAEVGGIWASPIAPSRLGRSPLRPRRALGPRALFPLDLVSARDTSQTCSMLVFTPFALCFVTLRGVFVRFPELTY
jgi:hypothetical protein